MATRENQGLQIALITFVIVTVCLTVATYMFFSKYREADDRNKQLANDNSQKDAAMRKALDESADYKTLLDPAIEQVEGAKEAANQDFEAHGKGLADADRNYRALVAQLAKDLAEANTRITAVTAHEKELADELAAEKASTLEAIKEYTATIAKVTADLDDRQKQFDAFQKQMSQDKTTLSSQFDEARQKFDADTKTTRDEVARLNDNVAELQRLVDINNDLKREREQANETPDGKISFVNQRTRTAFINVGNADGLRRQTTFSVYPFDAANPIESERKGTIEVTRLAGASMAEATILDDDVSNPLMPGDLIFSTAWEPGRAEHFALAGLMDIDGDASSDRQTIRNLISVNGGVIDAELADDGKKTGQMSVKTKYLVLGDPPPLVEGSAILAGWNDIQTEAKKLGIKTLDVAKFVDYLGYEPKERTVTLGSNSRASDFKPRLPDMRRPPEGSGGRILDLRNPPPAKDDYR